LDGTLVSPFHVMLLSLFTFRFAGKTLSTFLIRRKGGLYLTVMDAFTGARPEPSEARGEWGPHYYYPKPDKVVPVVRVVPEAPRTTHVVYIEVERTPTQHAGR